MSLADDIEFYGRAVDAGDITHSEATRLLARDSHGGLTEAGAADCIARWTTMCATYAALARQAADTLRGLTA